MAEQEMNVALIQGKVEEITMSSGKFYHRVSLPAADQYSNPGACVVEATTRLAEPGNEIKTKAHITGYSRRFIKKDGSAGYDTTTRFVV